MSRVFSGPGSSYAELGIDEVMRRLAGLNKSEADDEVLLSGGEALDQPEFLIALLDACAAKGMKTIVETTLYAPFSVAMEVARRATRILVNLRLMDSVRHLRLTGCPNTPILGNIQLLSSIGAPISLRFQILPGINDLPGDLEAAADFAALLPRPATIEIRPYSAACGLALVIPQRPSGPSAEEGMRRAASVFKSYGLKVSFAGLA
jgi:pyruvate formate lyase activating enzyme